MVGLGDLLTAIKNLVQSVSNLSIRKQTSATVTGTTLAITGTGTLINYSVTVAGSGVGTINNVNSVAGVTAANVLVAVPNTVGVYPVNVAFGLGLVVIPGAGQSINVTYSLGQ